MRRTKSPYSTIHACLHVQKRTISTNSSINKNTKASTIKRTNKQPTSTEEISTIFERFANQNNLNPSAWYQLSSASLDEPTKQIISKQFSGNLYLALSTIFPEIEWKAWKFQHFQVPQNFWNDKSNQRKFFDWLGKQFRVQKMDDWYEKLSHDAISKHGGRGLLNKYNGSPTAALMAVYPEHNWMPWKFNMVPKGYWSKSNQRKFFDWLGKELGVEKMDAWYEKLSHDAISKHGGGYGLLNKYNGSPTAALMAVYPEHNWIPWKFKTVSHQFWNSQDFVKQFLNELSEKLSIKTLDDWYLVGVDLQKQLGGARLLAKYKGLYNILKEQYPHHPWDPNRFNQTKKTQRWLAVTLKKMFPNEEILEDYMHPKAAFPSSNRPIQLDIYLPSRSLAFEYQGEQHYQDIGIFSPTRNYQQRDEEKRVVCAANNIKLIEVPYWWKRTQEDLQEIIHKSGISL